MASVHGSRLQCCYYECMWMLLPDFVERLWGCLSGGAHTYDAGLLLAQSRLVF